MEGLWREWIRSPGPPTLILSGRKLNIDQSGQRETMKRKKTEQSEQVYK